MHEYGIAVALIARVERECGQRQARRARRVHVRLGALSGVERELLQTAFENARAGTRCADAALEIHVEAVAWVCPACGESIAPGAVLRCPRCAQPARLQSGDAIILERIEMEGPHV